MNARQLPPIIDVEASGFGGTSYPIEVGVATANGEKYCTLIAPVADWTHWDAEAEKLHCISREVLNTRGRHPLEVTRDLNELLEDQVLYSDGWVVDKPWLSTLFHTAGVPMKFKVSPLEAILTEAQMACWHEIKAQVIAEASIVRHRASQDAWVIQETYRRTLLATADSR